MPAIPVVDTQTTWNLARETIPRGQLHVQS